MSEQSRIGLVTQLRRHAVAYPETTERDSQRRRTFEVRGNAFLSVGETGGSCEVTLKLDASLDTARAYGAAEPDHYAVGEDGWVTVRFSADKETPGWWLGSWITESFRLQAPEPAVAVLGHYTSPLDPESGPELDLGGMLEALNRHRVRWILTGSLVLIAHGARFEPGDVDLTPTLDQRNLDAIAAVLEELGSIPPHNSRFAECPPLDWHYAWLPRPATIYNLNMLHATTRGVLDVVPWNCGSYDELVPTAKRLDVGGYEILVAHPSTVFQHLEGRNRVKDVSRRDDYDRIRSSIEDGTLALTGLDHLL